MCQYQNFNFDTITTNIWIIILRHSSFRKLENICPNCKFEILDMIAAFLTMMRKIFNVQFGQMFSYILMSTYPSMLCKAQIPLGSTRLDTFDFVEPVETSVSSETSRAVPTWRTTNKLVQV